MGAIDTGLANVVVAETELSLVDGEHGRLVIRGHALEELAGKHRFAEVAGLLWDGRLPSATRSREIANELGEARARAFERVDELRVALSMPDGMEALRAAVACTHLERGTKRSARAISTRQRSGVTSGEPDEAGASLAGAVAVFAAAWSRISRGLVPVAPDRGADHAHDVLRMVRGEAPPRAHADALDRYLVSVVDHGMNASTFTARVVTSTGSDAVSAIVAAIGALKGPLHGGAPGPVLDMLDAIGTPDRATAWIEGELAARRRIMGMGHRVYRVRDPRAAVLEAGIEALERAGAASDRLRLARAVEAAAERALAERHPDRALRANVEFYTAVLLEAIGLPRSLFSPMFATGRVAGWWAHVLEQRAVGKLIRPQARYVGP